MSEDSAMVLQRIREVARRARDAARAARKQEAVRVPPPHWSEVERDDDELPAQRSPERGSAPGVGGGEIPGGTRFGTDTPALHARVQVSGIGLRPPHRTGEG